jgi:hypothetical protein
VKTGKMLSFPVARSTYRAFLLAALLLLPAACAGQATVTAPTPQVFVAPAEEIQTARFISLPGREAYDYFGEAVDVEGDLLVAGAPHWNRGAGEGAGAAYVLRRSSAGDWQVEATLTSSDRDDGFQFDQFFGESVAIHGNLIAVGAPGYDDRQAGDNIGAIYIFEKVGDSWAETARLTASQPMPGGRLGTTLVFFGDRLAVSGSPEYGRVLLFQREASGWRETAVVPAPASVDGEIPHVLMDLYGDTLAVSAVFWQPLPEGQDEQAQIQTLRRRGTVALYEKDGDKWKQTFQTSPQEASLFMMYQPQNAFGLPVALGGEAGQARWLAVGKPGFTKSGREQGSVAIYERGRRGWYPQAELTLAPGKAVPGALMFFSPDPGPVFFGAFVAFEGQRLAVVSTFANTVYIFERQGENWIYRSRLTPGGDMGDADDFQRRVVAMDGTRLILGSPGELGGGGIFEFDLAH